MPIHLPAILQAEEAEFPTLRAEEEAVVELPTFPAEGVPTFRAEAEAEAAALLLPPTSRSEEAVAVAPVLEDPAHRPFLTQRLAEAAVPALRAILRLVVAARDQVAAELQPSVGVAHDQVAAVLQPSAGVAHDQVAAVLQPSAGVAHDRVAAVLHPSEVVAHDRVAAVAQPSAVVAHDRVAAVLQPSVVVAHDRVAAVPVSRELNLIAVQAPGRDPVRGQGPVFGPTKLPFEFQTISRAAFSGHSRENRWAPSLPPGSTTRTPNNCMIDSGIKCTVTGRVTE